MSSHEKDAQFLKSNAAAMRALAGGKDHQVTYAGTESHIGKADVRLPALPPTATAAQKASLRGAADGAALWLAHHNPITHKKHCPTPDGAKAIFEAAERARVEAIGARHMKGVGANLEAALIQLAGGTALLEGPQAVIQSAQNEFKMCLCVFSNYMD